MNNLAIYIYVCENFYREYKKTIEQLGFNDVTVKTYPCISLDNKNKRRTKQLLQYSVDNKEEGIIFYSESCPIRDLIPESFHLKAMTANYCIENIVQRSFMNYILQNGGYIISSGWLINWNEYIAREGFDKETAQKFYKEFCTELIFLDSGIEPDAKKYLEELSSFLDLPYKIIPIDLEFLQAKISSAIYHWWLSKSDSYYQHSITELQKQCAEYSALFDLAGKLTLYTDKRKVIGKIKELFLVVFGARDFQYWSYDDNEINYPDEIRQLFSDNEKSYWVSKEKNRFCIKIQSNNKLFGIIDVSNFMFPRYLNRYLNFAFEFVKICGLIFTNIEQYQQVKSSEEKLEYLSCHDSLTGLYNRTYINEFLAKEATEFPVTVFMFDIDNLKYVNDTYGHLEGDKLIINAANMLRKCLRFTDNIARIGGDEFIAVLPETNERTAQKIQERIKQEIQTYNDNLTESHLKINISSGFAISKNQATTIEKLMQKADKLMYEEKKSKKDK